MFIKIYLLFHQMYILIEISKNNNNNNNKNDLNTFPNLFCRKAAFLIELSV